MLAVLLPLCDEPLSIGAYAAEKPTNTRDSSLRSVTTISARLARLEEVKMVRLSYLPSSPIPIEIDSFEGNRS
jgi:hypothetical protein